MSEEHTDRAVSSDASHADIRVIRGIVAVVSSGAIVRKRLSYRACLYLLLGALLAVGVVGLAAFGLVGGGVLLLSMFAILSAIAFGVRGGLIACAIDVVFVVAIGVAVHTGVITFSFDVATYATSITAWGIMTAGLVMCVSVIVIALGVGHSHLRSSLRNLRDSHAQHERLADNLVEAFLYRHGVDGVFTYLSSSITQVLGYEPEEFLTHFSEHLTDHPANQEAARFSEQSMHGVQPPRYEIQVHHKDGSAHWLEVSEVPVRDEDGTVVAVEGIAHEITERKRREEIIAAELRLSGYSAEHSVEELLRAFLDETEKLTGSEIGFYHFIEADQETIQLQAWSTNTLEHLCKAEGKGSHYSIDKAGVWVECVRKGRPVIHNDYASLPDRKGMPDGHAPVVRELVVPVYRDDKIVAILGVGNKKTDYVDDDVTIVSDLANMAWDVVSRVRAEEALQASEALLNESQAIASVGSWERDFIADHLAWSDETYRILGLSPENYVAAYETFMARVHPEDRAAVDAAYTDSLRDGSDRYEIEHRVLRKDTGMIRHVRQECRHLRNTSGQVVRSIGMIQDITEQKRMARAMSVLAEELAGLTGEKLFRALVERLAELLDVDYAAVGEWRADEPDTVSTAAFCSHGQVVENITYDLPGSPCENVIGKEVCSYPDGVSEKFPADQMLAEVGARGYVGMPLFDSEHRPMGLLWIVDTKPITDETFASSVLGSFAVRAAGELERKRAEEELARSSELKSKFIQVAGHELRTPLSYIMAMPKLVEAMDDVGKLKEAIHTMEAKARRLSDIVQSMFKLMPEEGYSEHLDLQRLHVSDMLEWVRVDCLPFVAERRQQLVIDQEEALPDLQADPHKIHDVLENLIGNAVKFTPEGGTIRVAASSAGAEGVRISVTDEGPGISERDMANIFAPFYSTDDVMKHSSGSIGKMKHGMGLGLTVVKHFTEMHGGTVEVTTGEGGSTFTVTLPVELPGDLSGDDSPTS
ncbi:MAG: GAF domain-containing protein [Planctomycetota bacterium]|jgi:PAS domain S-box-containing protein